ncbi:hypothetical protein GGR57DRAFT_288264 [Xylariaceae sp. FL1272]|nr:hypothetical protein GGR57DRAFT_288264 [Xylariaceae sp. FL1272]
MPNCGNARRAQSERLMRQLCDQRVGDNVPRPLYRHWVDVEAKDPDTNNPDPPKKGLRKRIRKEKQPIVPADPPKKELHIDEDALRQRRRLSLSAWSETLPPDPESLTGHVNQTSAPSGDDHKPSVERCYLLALPVEIRRMIWEYALGNRTLHIFYGKPAASGTTRALRLEVPKTGTPKMGSAECIHRPTPHGWENSVFGFHESCPDCGIMWNSFAECVGRANWTNLPAPDWEVLPPWGDRGTCHFGEVETSEWRPLALLSTCRKIYTEAVDVLYNTNTFRFAHPNVVGIGPRGPHTQAKLIQDLSTTLLPQRLERIAHVSAGVDVERLGDLDDVLASTLPNLRYLELRARVVTKQDWHTSNPDTESRPRQTIAMALEQMVARVRGRVRGRVEGAQVVLRANLDNRVPPLLPVGTELPEGLEVVLAPDKAWGKGGLAFDRF